MAASEGNGISLAGLSLRGQSALALLIAEAFLAYREVGKEDQELSEQGVALAWRWVDGELVDPQVLEAYMEAEDASERP
jgi:hypothetical protein